MNLFIALSIACAPLAFLVLLSLPMAAKRGDEKIRQAQIKEMFR